MLTILGPTASGKTRLAVSVANALGCEIISADSRQVYRGMDIGTGKDLGDYQIDDRTIPYHLIDIREAGEKYNLFEFQQDFADVYADIVGRGARPLLCGGTGLYIEAVLKGYSLSPVPQNPELRSELDGKSLDELTAILQELKRRNGSTMHNTTDVDTPARAIRAIEIETYNLHTPTPLRQIAPVGGPVVGIMISRELRRERISARLDSRLKEGMADEVRRLLDSGIAPDDLIYYGLEYKYLTLYVTGQLSFDEMHSQLEIAIHQFAKRQMTWFRGMERRGTPIHWIDGALPLDEQTRQCISIAKEYEAYK